MGKEHKRATQWITPQMLILFAVLISLPLWIRGVGLYQYLGVEILIWMIFALGYNLLLGYTGLPSFGHGAYFGIGAYAFGLSQFNITQSLLLGLLAGIIAAGLAGALVAAFISHRRGIYFALLTIAFGQVFWYASIKLHALTGGEDGLLNIPRPDIDLYFTEIPIKSNLALYYLVLIIFAFAVISLWRLVHSPFGKVIQAIKQNELRSSFIGYNVWFYKFLVFTISAAISGLAGSMFAMAQQSAYPDVMSLHASGFVVMMTLVGGGFVSFWGPVIGAVVFFLSRDLLGAATETWLLWYGLMFMVVVLFKPEGIAGMFESMSKKKSNENATKIATRVASLKR